MNFGEAPKYESGSLEEALAEANLPTDPRRLFGRWYKFSAKEADPDNKGIFIGTIVGLWFEFPHQIQLSVSDMRVVRILGYKSVSGVIIWRIWLRDGRGWPGEFILL